MKKHMLFAALICTFLISIVCPLAAAPVSSPGVAKPSAIASGPSSFALVEEDLLVSIPNAGDSITAMAGVMSQTTTSVEKARHTLRWILLVIVMIFLLELYSFIRTFVISPKITLDLKKISHEVDKKAAGAAGPGSATAASSTP